MGLIFKRFPLYSTYSPCSISVVEDEGFTVQATEKFLVSIINLQ